MEDGGLQGAEYRERRFNGGSRHKPAQALHGKQADPEVGVLNGSCKGRKDDRRIR